MTHDLVLLAVGLVLTVGTGLFVASEFALVNLDRRELEQRAAAGEGGLTRVIGALRRTSTHLSSAQLGITLTTLLTGYTFEPAVSSLLEGPLGAVGVGGTAASGVGGVVGVLLATVFSMVVGELVPKNFALAVPLATARAVVGFQVAFTAALRPVVVLLNGSANGLIRALGVEPQEELSGARTADELTYLIRHSARQGALGADDAVLLDRTLGLAERDAGDVMTPRVRMVSVPVTATADEVVEAAAASGHSRLPVIDGGPDDVVGLVHVKHAFAVEHARRPHVTAADLAVEVARVPETLGAVALLGVLGGPGLQAAVVVDEHGGTAGLVTLEDLVEELVGEVADEHDRHRPRFRRLDAAGRSVVLDAVLRPDEVRRELGIAVPEGEWDTVAGYLAARLGRVPEVGDEVELDTPDGGRLRVERTDGPRVLRVRHVAGTGAGR